MSLLPICICICVLFPLLVVYPCFPSPPCFALICLFFTPLSCSLVSCFIVKDIRSWCVYVWRSWACFSFSAQVGRAVLCGIPSTHQTSSEGAFLKSSVTDVWCRCIVAFTSRNVFCIKTLKTDATSAKYSGFVSLPVFPCTSLSRYPLACLLLWRLFSLN